MARRQHLPKAAAFGGVPRRGTDQRAVAGLRGALPAAAGLFGAGARRAGAAARGRGVALVGLVSWIGRAAADLSHRPEVTSASSAALPSRSAFGASTSASRTLAHRAEVAPAPARPRRSQVRDGAGGKEEIALAYLSLAEAERLRVLVRERSKARRGGCASAPKVVPSEEPAELLFALDNRRLVRFGLFEFSLGDLRGSARRRAAVRFPVPVQDMGPRRPASAARRFRSASPVSVRSGVGAALGALLVIVLLGVLTGIACTFAREYDFRLELTARGFAAGAGCSTRATLHAGRTACRRLGVRIGLCPLSLRLARARFPARARAGRGQVGASTSPRRSRGDEISADHRRRLACAPPPEDIA